MVKLGTPKAKRLDRSDERSKRGSERTKRKGEIVHPHSFVSNPSSLFRFFKFLLAKNPTKHVFFLIFLFDRSSSFRNDFACSNAPNRSVNRYDALKLFLCFGSSCHGVVIGQALHPVPLVTLHTLFSLCFGSSQHSKSEAKLYQY